MAWIGMMEKSYAAEVGAEELYDKKDDGHESIIWRDKKRLAKSEQEHGQW